MSDARVVVDYEELDRMAAVWRAAASTVARLGVGVAELAAAPEILANAIFDPVGAARTEADILGAAIGPHSLMELAAGLEVDAMLLAAVVAKEQLVDDLPARQLWAVESWLVAAPVALALDPVRAVRQGAGRFAILANAMIGYASPHAVPLFELLAPSSRFRIDVLERRPIEADPIFGVPLARSIPRANAIAEASRHPHTHRRGEQHLPRRWRRCSTESLTLNVNPTHRWRSSA